jgi:hypothetical protein
MMRPRPPRRFPPFTDNLATSHEGLARALRWSLFHCVRAAESTLRQVTLAFRGAREREAMPAFSRVSAVCPLLGIRARALAAGANHPRAAAHSNPSTARR